MATTQARLQALSEDYQKLQQDLQSSVDSRQKLDGQRQENLSVQKEFETLAEDETIYKLSGPVLLKQEKFEAENTVKGRLDFIGNEMSRLETQIKETQSKIEKKRTEIIQAQTAAQQAAGNAGAKEICRTSIYEKHSLSMDASSTMRPGRPPSIQELVSQAENFAFNVNIPLRHWIRTAETLCQEAAFAMSDSDYGRAYMMLYRHSVLVLNYLVMHPEYKDPLGRKSVKALQARIGDVIQELEMLKPAIEASRQEWERMRPEKRQRPISTDGAASSYAGFAAQDPTLQRQTTILDAAEHQDLAVDLAQEELDRRTRVRRTKQDSYNSRTTSLRPYFDSWRNDYLSKTEDVDLQQQMAAVRNNLDRNTETVNEADPHGQGLSSTGKYYYPSVSRPQPIDVQREQQPAVPPKFPALVPERPPKEAPQRWHANEEPPVPPPNYNQSLGPTLPPKAPLSAPAVPKKERLTFKPGAYLENGDPIRSMFIPSKLRRTFLDIAAKNTNAGLEMCGILCGSPVNNALFVRCLVIPDQKCTSDTVETVNEGTLAEYCMNEDLLVLGWIHTHPTQTCFMSSRDLHTHAGYQIMMPESVAIVCAPKFSPSYGIFRLTHPPGLNHILDCKQTSTFHPHSIDNLYCETEHPTGHVYESDKLPFEVQDLRTQ